MVAGIHHSTYKKRSTPNIGRREGHHEISSRGRDRREWRLPLLATHLQAAELKVFATMSVKGLVEELGPQFEKTTENKLNFTIGGSADLKAQIDQGAAFDVAILTVPLIDALAAAGKLDGYDSGIVARAGLGVSVRARHSEAGRQHRRCAQATRS